MPNSSGSRLERTDKFILPVNDETGEKNSTHSLDDPIARMERSVSAITLARPSLQNDQSSRSEIDNYKGLLEVSAAVNSSMVTDEILQIVMKRAIELLKAERGFLMLLDEKRELKIRTVYNLCKEELMQEDFKFSGSIANRVAEAGESVYTSDALSDDRFSRQESVRQLNLRSILCVPLKIKDKIIGVIYLDNSIEARLFLESDLYLFELFAQQAAIAIENSRLYERIMQLNRFNQNIISNTPVGLLVLGHELNILTMNAVAENVFECSLSKGLTLSDLLPEKNYGPWEQTCQNVINSGTAEELKRNYIAIGEDEKVLSVKFSPLENASDQQRGLVIVIEDVTERTILENYVTISEKLIAKGEMAASIGHELNNFLAIISTNAELMAIRVEKGQFDKLTESVTKITENVQKIKRFTDNLMDLSKLDREPVRYNLNHLIEDVLFSVKPQQRFKDVTFIVRTSPELPDCNIDVGQIQQVFLNLLYNAGDAVAGQEGKREIVITTGANDDKVYVIVRDSGCGIAAANLDKIFEQHFSTKIHGHGLGLSNCKRIIENHNGSIKVESREGEYTKFQIELPVSADSGD